MTFEYLYDEKQDAYFVGCSEIYFKFQNPVIIESDEEICEIQDISAMDYELEIMHKGYKSDDFICLDRITVKNDSSILKLGDCIDSFVKDSMVNAQVEFFRDGERPLGIFRDVEIEYHTGDDISYGFEREFNTCGDHLREDCRIVITRPLAKNSEERIANKIARLTSDDLLVLKECVNEFISYGFDLYKKKMTV